jgi:molybdenum cofactor guanylyltransferase
MRIQNLVVAGGKSRRFGGSKALHRFGGRAFIDHVLDALALVPGGDPWVGVPHVGSDPALTSHLMTRGDVTFLEDHAELAGPLASIAAGLAQARRDGADWLLVVGCDMPGLRMQLISALCDRAYSASLETSAIVPRTRTERGPRYQALHGLYRPAALEYAVQAQRLQDFVGSLPSADILDEPELSTLDPQFAQSVFNVNTPADLEALEALLFAS